MIKIQKALLGIAAALLMSTTLLAGCTSTGEDGTDASSGSDANISGPSHSDAQSSPIDVQPHEDNTEGNGMRQPNSASMTINGTSFAIELSDNATSATFAAMLPMEVEMSELNGNEKYVYLGESLPANASNPGTIEAGDVMLYGDNCLVVFYESHSTTYSYTRIGKIKNAAALPSTMGTGSIKATFALS